MDDLQMQESIREVTDFILNDYHKGRYIDQHNTFNHPDKDAVVDLIFKIERIIFPGFFNEKAYRYYTVENKLSTLVEDVIFNLTKQMTMVLQYLPEYQDENGEKSAGKAQELSIAFLKRIPEIRKLIETDVQAEYDGDPAAFNKEEIIYSYPGLFAIMVYRMAHELVLLGVPVIPRMMTEHAHSVTGIDIHPGATIGEYFFIDHGTGIVIGETTIIGDNVKIYQGVTIGALSTRKGQLLKGKKRHPTIEDNVTIYAGASILGGETVIGEGAVIGANAFITSSVPKNARVSMQTQDLNIQYPHK
ncbi:MAG: serine O-acetyltransferase EpsC [Lachnospiraceae bacterium]|nr:serine O-acetyltransferase EpsC [Lachnospiraceae bacterium]